MINVLQLRSSFDPGGTETTLLNLFNYPQQYFRIHFVLLRDGSLIDQLDESSGNRYYRWFRKRFLDLGVLRRMHRLIREEQISIIHTHQFIELLYAVCLKALRPRLKIVYHNHILFPSKDWSFYLEKYLSHYFSRTITVSQAAKDELVHQYGFSERKISVLYNAVRFGRNGQTPAAGLQEKLDPSRFHIVMVANFVWGKDHETIFRAYDAHIREQLPEVCFHFIGRKSEISERLVNEYLTDDDLESGRVVLWGAIPNAKSLLPNFDLVVMSCFSETFNQALVEAACMGLPILASDIPVFRELSEEGRYFAHFQTGKADDLFQRLKEQVAHPQKEAAQRYAPLFREKFSFDKLVEEHYELYISELHDRQEDKRAAVKG